MDFFIISENILNMYANCDILPAYRSNHSRVTLELNISYPPPGRGTWKLNNSCLSDPKLIDLIKEDIAHINATYAATPYSTAYLTPNNANDIELMLLEDLLWDVLLTQLRGVVIRYCAKKKRDTNNLERLLERDIRNFDKKLNDERNLTNQNRLHEANKKLDKIREN